MTDVRHDPATGRWAAIAPGRVRRPGGGDAPAADREDTCPFCAGHEDQTPPETLRLGDGPTGWDVRVVPNLYPALERQEVVIHGPAHLHSIAELPDETLDLVAAAWQQRANTAGGICFPILNEGREAGASLPHSHSQLAWLPVQAPETARERGLPKTLDVACLDGVAAGCPVVSRVPYELLIAPAAADGDWRSSPLLAPALRLFAELTRRLHRVHGGRPVPLNAWLHDNPRWHLEVLPRETRLAGLELGAGVYINPLAPEDAALQLANA